MKTIKAKNLDFSSVQIDTMYLLPVIKTEDIPAKGLIYLVLKEEFENAEDEDDIRLAYPKIVNRQIRVERESKLITFPGLLEKKKNLTVIE